MMNFNLGVVVSPTAYRSDCGLANTAVMCCCCFCCYCCRSGASPILLPNAHVEHKPAAAAAAVAAATAAAAAAAEANSSSKKHKWQRGQQQQQQQQRSQQEQRLLDRLQQLQQQQRQQQQMFDAAGQLTSAELRLGQDNQFLPPEAVLQLSEFMLPVDSKTLDFYRLLLS
jgi:hypothetical protein